jgi:hypothetical protein
MTTEEMEREICKAAIEELIAAGYSISVRDDEYNVVIGRSRNVQRILDNLFATDEERLEVYFESKYVGAVFLVHGNDGYDVITGYSDKLEPDLRKANELSEKYEKEKSK